MTQALRSAVPGSLEDRAFAIVAAYGGEWHGAYGLCRCPAHQDRTASLSVRVGDRALLFKCFAGCTTSDILSALKSGQHKYGGRPSDVPRPVNDFSALAQHIWSKALPIRNSLAQTYLSSRGIAISDWPFRFDPRTQIKQRGEYSYHPALVAAIRNESGQVAIQRTLLSRDGMRKATTESPKRMLGHNIGGAIRIGTTPTTTLRLAEGLEDACSVIELERVDHCWAVCGIERYAQIAIPASVKHIIIYSQHGREAATAIDRARPHLTNNLRSLDVILPTPGGDWNDRLRVIKGIRIEL